MKQTLITMLVDLGILLFLVAVSFGLWFCPWITVLLFDLVLLGGYFFGHDSG